MQVWGQSTKKGASFPSDFHLCIKNFLPIFLSDRNNTIQIHPCPLPQYQIPAAWKIPLNSSMGYKGKEKEFGAGYHLLACCLGVGIQDFCCDEHHLVLVLLLHPLKYHPLLLPFRNVLGVCRCMQVHKAHAEKGYLTVASLVTTIFD